MGRTILILTAVCLLATFLIISNSSFKPNTGVSPQQEDAGKKAEKDRPTKSERPSRARAAKRASAKRSHPDDEETAKEDPGTPESLPEKETLSDPGHAIVKGDFTPVYSVNSRDSNIMKLLKKGDRVATDVEVTDEQGRWTVVKKGDLAKPGFVLGEKLQRADTARKTENRNAVNRKPE